MRLIDAIKSIEGLVERLNVVSPKLPRLAEERAPATKRVGSRRRGSTRDVILRLLTDAAKPMRTSEIVRGVVDSGAKAHPDTIRGLVSQMGRAGELHQVERGLYRLPGPVPMGELPAAPERIEQLFDDSGRLAPVEDDENAQEDP